MVHLLHRLYGVDAPACIEFRRDIEALTLLADTTSFGNLFHRILSFYSQMELTTALVFTDSHRSSPHFGRYSIPPTEGRGLSWPGWPDKQIEKFGWNSGSVYHGGLCRDVAVHPVN